MMLHHDASMHAWIPGVAAMDLIAFVAVPGVDLSEILCIQEERKDGNDNTVSFNRMRLQIPEGPLRPHFVKATVKVRCYPNGTHAIFHGQRCLDRYNAKGPIVDEKKAA